MTLTAFPISPLLIQRKAIDACKDNSLNNYKRCHSFGYSFLQASWLPDNKQTAKTLLTHACEGAVAQACGLVGSLIEDTGNSFAIHREAYEFFQKGCDFNSGWSCDRLGIKYYNGEGRRNSNPEFELAAKHFKKSCDLGIEKGCADMGLIIVSGHYIPTRQENPKLLEWVGARCRAGNPEACNI